jgi:hypothetical protein
MGRSRRHFITCLLVPFGCLVDHPLPSVERFELGVRQSESEGDDEVATTSDLGHLLVGKGFHAMRGRAGKRVALTQLARIVRSPGVELACAGQDRHETRATQLEVLELKLVHTLHTVRRVKLAKGACTPEIKLLIHRESSRESSSSHFDYLGEGELSQEYRDI